MRSKRPIIGKLLAELRTEKGLFQKEISAPLGHARPDLISRYENGSDSPTNTEILRVLTVGFGLPEAQAKHTLGRWLIIEASQTYGIKVSIQE